MNQGKLSATRLAGLRAVVTGSSSGIGEAIARRFADEGAKVVVHYRRRHGSATRLAESISEAGGEAVALAADLTNQDEIDSLVDRCWETWGGIDIWVNNAGADILTEEAEANDESRLRKLLEVDLLGTMRCSWRCGQRMRDQGHGVLLNMSWDMVFHGMAGRNPELFSAVKGGVLAFSKSLALSLAPEVRVNILAPGWIETAFARNVMTTEYRKKIEDQTPLQRFGKPEEVAAAAAWLASGDAAFITGQTIKINGGISS
ncbi:MAG: SDR family NAD(P)-dependent oxidoreductase [Candidatus Porifericomitaceae bacterium WSBS_2022_MAG_OTU9]